MSNNTKEDIKTPDEIIWEAWCKYQPIEVVLMVSGGHDSVTNAHRSVKSLKRFGIPFRVYHGDTTIGIPATQDYVKMICELYGWTLDIRKPPNREWWYDRIVEKYGFPGPTKSSHQLMYRLLKERALRRYVTHELKSDPSLHENVLLLSGVRKQESAIRMGYTDEINKDGSRIWCNPIFYWSEEDCRQYMAENDIPKNPVKEKLCISGECLCGAFAGAEEWAEIKHHYPETAKVIEDLHRRAIANGHPWPWSSGPNEWEQERLKKMQLSFNFMCVGCEAKKNII